MQTLFEIPDIYKGAILTFLVLVLIEFIKSWLNKRSYKNNFVIFIKLELSAILKDLEKIKLKITEQNIFDFTYIIEIEKILTELENARTSAIYLSEKNQSEYFDILLDIRSCINECRFVQNTYYDHNEYFEGKRNPGEIRQIFKTPEDNQAFFNQKKLEKLISISDIKEKINKFVNDVQIEKNRLWNNE